MNPFDCITDFIFVEDPPETVDVIFIPGGSHPQLMERAADLYLRGFAPYLLPSGGANPRIPDYASEWEFLQKIALLRGVPEQAILREDKARHTFENAELSCGVMRAMNLPVERAMIVCKAFHARRALLTYQSVFLKTTFKVSPVTDHRGITRENWFMKPEYISAVMTEVRKIGEYFGEKIPRWVNLC